MFDFKQLHEIATVDQTLLPHYPNYTAILKFHRVLLSASNVKTRRDFSFFLLITAITANSSKFYQRSFVLKRFIHIFMINKDFSDRKVHKA